VQLNLRHLWASDSDGGGSMLMDPSLQNVARHADVSAHGGTSAVDPCGGEGNIDKASSLKKIAPHAGVHLMNDDAAPDGGQGSSG
jgi:hypothetical protein